MAKLSEEFSGNYLKVDDLEGKEQTLTITEISIKTFKEKDGYEKKKVVVTFKEIDSPFILNVTNRETIKELYGDDTDDWEGKRVTLFPTKVLYEGKKTPCIRIKDEVPKAGKSASSKAKTSVPPRELADDDEADDEAPY